MRLHKRRLFLLPVVAVILLIVCFADPDTAAHVEAAIHQHPAGFWYGLWQGFILPFAFIVSLFNHHVGIYSTDNVGTWYNFGFVLGAAIIFIGGSSLVLRD